MQKPVEIKPANGKLGILLPGMGAVGTTFIAGCLLARRDIAKPFGSLTQMGTIRLGKRTDARTPLIKDFVPLAGLDDLVFGAENMAVILGEPSDAHDPMQRAGRFITRTGPELGQPQRQVPV